MAETAKPRRGGPRRRANTSSFRRRVWWLIRKNKCVTMDSILTTLWDGEGTSPENNVGIFLAKLAKVGILTVLDERQPDGKLTSNGLLVYVLARDIGPHCPVLRVKGNVYDPNGDEILEPIHAPKSLKAKRPPAGGKGGVCLETEEYAT